MDWELGSGELKGLSDEQFQAMVSELASFPDRAAVYERLRSKVELTRIVVERLLHSGTKLPPPQVEELLSELRCEQSLPPEFWLEDKRLEGALDRLADQSPFSRRLWARLVNRIKAGNFDDSPVTAEMAALFAVYERFPNSIGSESLKRLNGWNTLGSHFGKPSKTPLPGTSAKLQAACLAVGQSREALITAWFSKWVLHAPNELERKRRNEVLGLAFLGFYETEDTACAMALKLCEEVKDSGLRKACKTELFTTIVSDANLGRLAVTHQDELRETSIRPRSKSPEPVRSKSRGKTGLGVGSLRLPPEATPYVGAFVMGSVLTSIFMLVLWFANVGDLAAQKGQSPEGSKAVETQKKGTQSARAQPAETNRKPKDSEEEQTSRQDEVTELTKTVGSIRDELGKKQTEIDQLKSQFEEYKKKNPERVADAVGPPSGTTPKPGEVKAPDPNEAATIAVKQLRDAVWGHPLKNEDFPRDRELVNRVEKEKLSGPDSKYVSSVKKLLTGLSAYDLEIDGLPRDPALGRAKPDKTKTDFAFLASGQDSRALLAARSYRAVRAGDSFGIPQIWSFYFLDSSRPNLIYLKRVKSDFNLRASSSSGDFFLVDGVDASGDRVHTIIYPVQSKKFYGANEELANNAKAIPASEKPVRSIDNNLDARLALSDGGNWYAFAEYASGKTSALPTVEVYSTADPNGEPAKILDFAPYKEDLRGGWKNLEMSFDREAGTLVVGFENKTFLLAFDLHTNPAVGPDLRLVSAGGPGGPGGIPTDGKNLIVVADVNRVLRFLIFDPSGKRVVDTDEKQLADRARPIEDLKKQLKDLWPLQELTPSEKSQIITTVTSILNYIPPVSSKIPFGIPVRGWAHGPHGSLAVVTELNVWDGNKLSLRDGKPADFKTLSFTNAASELTCVAFSPNGTILATGDEGWGRHDPSARGEPHHGAEMIRLAHEGPIMKVGFSPDGRVLAALAQKNSGRGEVRQGIIRLWLTENWGAR